MNRYLIIWLFTFSRLVHADNLGVQGMIYPIAEQDFLHFIEARLSTLQKNGEIKRHQKIFQTRALASTDRPMPVSEVSKATKSRVFYWDPTITHDGKQFNPLSQVALTRTLLFYDGDDSQQVQWVKETTQRLENKTVMILVKGSVSQQSKQLERAIYFDQYGKITQKLGIRHMPAVVKQEQLRLRIEEVKL